MLSHSFLYLYANERRKKLRLLSLSTRLLDLHQLIPSERKNIAAVAPTVWWSLSSHMLLSCLAIPQND